MGVPTRAALERHCESEGIAAATDKNVQVRRVVLKGVKLESRTVKVPNFDAEFDFSPEGVIQKAALEAVDGKLSVQITPRGDEFDIMTDQIVVLELRDTTQERRQGYELALDQGALTAFLSWLESRPSPRARRRSV